MRKVRRSSKKLPPEQVEELSKLAQHIDREERDEILALARASFARHERLIAIMHTLKAERERQGISLSEVARRIGADVANLHRLENNPGANPTVQTLERYAAALGKRVAITLVDEQAA